MTDPLPSETPPPAATRVPTWLKVVLTVSVALNLAVAGLALGAFLKDGRRHGGMPRDLSFGPFSEALGPEDRQALRTALRERLPEVRTERAAARAEFDTLLAALRSTPFDPAALTASLDAIETRLTGRIQLGRSLIEERLLGLSEAERTAFADRLENGLRRGDRD